MHSKPFALLKPQNLPARWDGEPSYLHLSELAQRISKRPNAHLIIDLETQGTDQSNLDNQVVGIGVAAEWGTHYAAVEDVQDWYEFVVLLHTWQVPLVAHNVSFDGAWMTRDLALAQKRNDGFAAEPDFHNWHACTLAVYRWLACEGWIGQKYGLKQAMVDLLGWPESNEGELDQWLVDNGYAMQHGGPDKSQMWRAPTDILGKYCWFDAEATYLLWAQILLPVLSNFAIFDTYLPAFMSTIRHVIWQKLRGIHIDQDELREYRSALDGHCIQLLQDFLSAPGVREAVHAFNTQVIEEHRANEPVQFKKMPELGTEPAKLKKDGTVSKNWLKWNTRKAELEGMEPEHTSHWLRWRDKHTRMQQLMGNIVPTEDSKELRLFNVDSAQHKQYLFYKGLNYEVKAQTDSGEPAVDEDALLVLKPHGPMLIQYNERNKIRTMVQGCLDKLRGNLLHVGLKCPGTYTGRLGGADGLNVQNVAKDAGYLKCWKAAPGHKLVIFDVASLEPHVLAMASGDPTLMRLYGPDSTGWDCVYLSVGAQLGGKVGQQIRAAGYDPLSNSKESVSHAKKEAKSARQIAKLIHLGASYGAGPGKIRQGLALQGIEIPFEEAKAMHEKYWQLFAAVKEYEKFLLAQWERTGGWFLNPIGRPMGVASDYLKDIVNRSIQGSGHDIFVLLTMLAAHIFMRERISYAPYIWDIHDCVMIEVPEEQAQHAKELLDGPILEELNSMLSGSVKFKGEANIVDNWWQDKES